MKQLLKQTVKFSFLILAVSLLGCNDDNNDTNLPEVNAGFTYTVNEDTGTVTFINISTESRTYLWTFGDGGTSTEINPVKTYANGTYKVTLKASSVSGASGTFEDTIVISIPNPMDLPITFDDPNVAYNVATFNGASFEILENPDVSGTNDKASKVGAITNSGAAYEGVNFDLGTQLDLSTDKTIIINFWADTPVDVLMKLEQGTGPDIEVMASHGGTGWEIIPFDFDSSDKYVRITVFVDGPGTTAGTFYIDDIEQTETIVIPVDGCDADPIFGDTGSGPSTLPLDFETGPTGGSSLFTVFEADTPQLQIVANPDQSGVNTTETVAKFQAPLGGAQYAGTKTLLDTPFTLDNTNSTVKIMVWKSVISDVGIKFEANEASTGEIKIPNTLINQWEEITFDFSGKIGEASSTNIDAIVIFPDFDDRTQCNVVYFDNVSLSSGGGSATEPTVAAPTPSQDAANVISIFSDAYTDITGVDLNPGWGQSTVQTIVDIEGNATLKYADFNYQGTDFSGNAQDVSGMEFLHVDMWTADATDVKVTPINGTGSPTENLVGLSPITTGQWTSYDIPLSDFTGSGMTLDQVIQMKFDGQEGTTPSNIFLDNIYFYKTSGGGGGGDYNLTLPIDFEPSGYGADWTWNVFEDDTNPPLEFVANPNASGVNTSSTVAKITALQAGQPWVGTETAHGEMGIIWDLSASNAIIKIMVYKTVISDVGFKLVNVAGGAQTEIKVPNTKINEWEELTFDFSGRIGDGLDGSTNIDQIVVFPDFNLDGRTTDNVVYFDNIRFVSN